MTYYSGFFSDISSFWMPKWLEPYCYWFWINYKDLEECAKHWDYQQCRQCFEPKPFVGSGKRSEKTLKQCIADVEKSNLPSWDKEYNICLCKYWHPELTGVRKCEYNPPFEYKGTAPQILPTAYIYYAGKLGVGQTLVSVTDDVSKTLMEALGISGTEHDNEIKSIVRAGLIIGSAVLAIKLVKRLLEIKELRKPIKFRRSASKMLRPKIEIRKPLARRV